MKLRSIIVYRYGAFLFLPALTAVLLLSGCTVGRPWTRPAPFTGIAYHDSVSTDTSRLAAWFELYQDTALQRMIRMTLDSNRDLLTAASRMEEARAQAAITRAALYPSLGYQAQAGGGRAGIDARRVSGGYDGAVFNGYGVLSWEIDLWGRLRGTKRSDIAAYLSLASTRNALQVSLIAEVASQYFLLRDLDNRLLISQRTLEGRQTYTRILSERFDKGYIPELDKLQAIQQEADVAATLPSLQRQIVETENTLRLLTGQGPGTVSRGYANVDQVQSPAIPVGLPSQLLERRPDVLSAELALQSQFERIGVAQASRLPSLSLTGMLGLASPQLSSLVSNPAFVANGLGAITGPIFNFSQLKNRVRVEQRKTEQAAYQYQQTVLGAFRDVDNALTYVKTYAEEYAQRKRQAEASIKAQRLSDARYDHGFTSFLEVLVQQENLFTAQLQESAALQGKLNATVLLYKSLGGGW